MTTSPASRLGLLLLAVAAGLACHGVSSPSPPRTCAERLVEWGLPTGMCRDHARFVTLQLPATVDDLGWLQSRRLRELVVEGPSDLRQVGPLPPSVRSLSLTASRITAPRVPRHLERLDVTDSPVRSLHGLPASLRHLALSDVPADQLRHLPDGLEELHLVYNGPYAELQDLGSLSRLDELRLLELDGVGILSLEGIPASVEELHLATYQVKFVDLPDDLRRLVLAHNNPSQPATRIDELPLFLEEVTIFNWLPETFHEATRYAIRLSLHEVPVAGLDLPSTLEDLTLYQAEGLTALPPLPDGLRRLHFSAARIGDDPALGRLPASLTSLTMVGFRGSDVLELPSTLRRLALPWATIDALPSGAEALSALDLQGVPPFASPSVLKTAVPELEELEWRSYGGARGPALPDGLLSLDMSDSPELKQLADLPQGLVTLRVANSGLTSLPRLPASLTTLDVSGCDDLVLPSLPSGLVTLVVSPGQLDSMDAVPAKVTELRFDSL